MPNKDVKDGKKEHRILAINIKRLKNVGYLPFCRDVLHTIEVHGAAELGIEDIESDLKESFNRLSFFFMRTRKSERTNTITSLNNDLNKSWKGLADILRGHIQSPFSHHAEYAEQLLHHLLRHGDPRRIGYASKRSIFNTICGNLLDEPHAQQLEELHLMAWVMKMKEQLEEFNSLIIDRNTERSLRVKGSMTEQRAINDVLYKKLVDTIHAQQTLGIASPAVDGFIKLLNICLKRTKRYSLPKG